MTIPKIKMVHKDNNNVTVKFLNIHPDQFKTTAIQIVSKDTLIQDSVKSNVNEYCLEYNECVYNHCAIILPNDEEIQVDPATGQKDFEEIMESSNAENACLKIVVHYDNKEAQYSGNESQLGTPENLVFDRDSLQHSDSDADKPKKIIRRCRISTKHIRKSSAREKNNKISYNNTENVEPKYVGLVNQAMTCYLNSLLQALYMTPEFRNALYNWEFKSPDEDAEVSSIPYQLQKLFLNLQTSPKAAVETTSLTRSFGWDSSEAWQQHDIQELCRVMFDALEQKFKNTAQADLINRLYEGKINDYVKCLTCNTEKSREDTFLDIPLPVRPFDTNEAYGSVEEALEAFVKYETLEGTNQYFCEKCDAKSNAHKGLKFTKFPYILTLQLKRFDFDKTTYHRIKLNDKVTFPDVLNLNTFIKSSQESLTPQEDVGMSIKCDDSCTTDSSTMDEEGVQCDETMSDNDYPINHDQEDDEGVDMSSGMSNSHNELGKLHEEYANTKGPYIYELFSIMIHSGSASGGHYYAYIKDFRTNKWLCFNDQLVTHITHSEIQKTYGGGNRGVPYSGAYRSSTNAYMLMYRQIDPERNALPMKAEDFPPHIKALLKEMKKSEEEQNYHDEQYCIERRVKKPINFRHTKTGMVDQLFVNLTGVHTFGQLITLACEQLSSLVSSHVEPSQCRIVSYRTKYDIVDRSYDYDDDTRLTTVFSSLSEMPDLLLDFRDKKGQFEDCNNTPLITKVYLIDPVERNIVDGPKYVRAYEYMKIRDFKKLLEKHFKVDANKVQLLSDDLSIPNLLGDEDEFEPREVTFPIIISATEVYDADTMLRDNLRLSPFYRMTRYLKDIVTFFIDTHKVRKETLETSNVPTLDEYYGVKEKPQENALTSSKSLTEELNKLSMTSSWDCYKFNNTTQEIESESNDVSGSRRFRKYHIATKRDQWIIQETSNSEDSSLSDSDRTLVGDVPEESELDCESELAPTNLFDQYSMVVKNESEKTKRKVNESEYKNYFKITQDPNRRKIWKISMDSEIMEEELKEKLEPYLKIPKDYFKFEGPRSSSNRLYFREDKKYHICVGRIVQADEWKISVYLLEMESLEPMQEIFKTILKQDMEFGVAKSQIFADLKRKLDRDIPQERWRFMAYNDNNETVGSVLTDDCLCCRTIIQGIVMQKITDEELCPESTQFIVYARKWNRTELELEDPQKLIIDKDRFDEQLKEEISAKSNIPIENLEFCAFTARKSIETEKIESFNNCNPCTEYFKDLCTWKTDVQPEDVDFKTYLLYRDSKETPSSQAKVKFFNKVVCAPNYREVFGAPNRREVRHVVSQLSVPMTSSPRKEKALKIHT